MTVGHNYLVKVSSRFTPEQLTRALAGESHLVLSLSEGTYRLVGVRVGGWLEVVRVT